MAVFRDQDWERSQSMNVQKAKPYHKQEQISKQYQKVKQVPTKLPKPKYIYHQEELPFNDKPWRERSLTDTEIEELFWGKLVQLGWRIETYGDETTDIWVNHTTRKNIVLPCPYCNNKLETIVWEFLNPTNAKKMSDENEVKKRIESHGGFVCQAKGTPEA
jgi:hypothetical protein